MTLKEYTEQLAYHRQEIARLQKEFGSTNSKVSGVTFISIYPYVDLNDESTFLTQKYSDTVVKGLYSYPDTGALMQYNIIDGQRTVRIQGNYAAWAEIQYGWENKARTYYRIWRHRYSDGGPKGYEEYTKNTLFTPVFNYAEN